MIMLGKFETHLPHFPIVLQEDIPQFKEICQQSLRELTRLQRLSLQYRTPIENELLKGFEFIQILHHDCPNHDFHFFNWIQNSVFQSSHILELELSKIWTYEFRTNLIDEDDPNPLYYIFLLKDLFWQPAQIAGLLIALLQHNVRPQDILSSGLLHDFFSRSSDRLSDVHKIYQMMRDRGDEHPQILEFLQMVSQSFCEMPHNPHMALDGCLQTHPLQSIEIHHPSQSYFFSEHLFHQAIRLFDDEFIIYILQLPQEYEHSFISISFNEWLNAQSYETIKHLYKKLFFECHPIHALEVFKNLTKFTNPEILERLFEEQDHLFWVLLGCVPEHLKKFTKKQIFKLAQQHEVNEKNQNFVALVCKNRRFKLLQEDLYFKLFQLQLLHGSVDEESSILDDLFDFKKSQVWCEQHEKIMLKRLMDCIDSNLIDFSIDQFINIKDFFYAIRHQLEILRTLGFEITKFPSDYYSFSSTLLSQLFKLNKQKNFSSNLDIITYHTQKDSEMQNTLKKALLINWFIQSKDIEALILIANELHHQLKIPLSEIHQLFKDKKINFSTISFHTPFTLTYYLNLFPEDEKLKELNIKIPGPDVSILQWGLKKPEFFSAILESLNAEQITRALSRYTLKGEALWFSIPLDEKILNLLTSKLSSQELFILLHLKSKLEQNIFHLHYSNPKLIKVLFSAGHIGDYQELLIQKDCFQHHPLFLSIENPEVFQIFLNSFPVEKRFKAILNIDYGDLNLFEMSIGRPQIILEIFNLISPSEKLILSQLYLDELIIHHTHHPEIIKQLLSIYHQDILDLFLSQHLSDGKRVIDYFSNNQDILFLVIKNLRPDHIYMYLLENNALFLGLIAKNKPEFLIELFDFIDDLHLTHLLQSDLFFKSLFQSKEILYNYLDRLSESQILCFLNHQNHHQQEWIDLLPLDHQMLDAVFSLSSQPRELINTKLINKVINHPLCLRVLIQYLPDELKTYWIFSLKESFLQHLKSIQSLLCLFHFLTPDQHINLLIIKHKKYQTLYHWLIQDYQYLIQIMPQFNQETLTFINHKVIQNKPYLETFSSNPERVNTYLELLNSQQCFEFLISLCQHHAEKPLEPSIKFAILKFAINYQGRVTSFSPRHFSIEQQKSPFWSAIKNAKFFKDCIPALELKGMTIEF